MHDKWPCHYTSDELEAIAQSIGHEKLNPLAVGKVQEAVEAYQWASAAEQGAFIEQHGATPRSLSKRRREKLKNIISLCEQGEVDETDIALNELDGWTSQQLGPVNTNDLARVKSAAERVLQTIQISGPDRQLGDVAGDAPRIVHREHMGYVSISPSLATIDISKCLPVGIFDFVAAGDLLDGPWWWKAAGHDVRLAKTNGLRG